MTPDPDTANPPALDAGDDHPDLCVGEPVDAEHDVDIAELDDDEDDL